MNNPCFKCKEFPCSWTCIDKNKYDKYSVKTECPFCGAIPSKITNGSLIITHKKDCFLSDNIQNIMSSSWYSTQNEERVITAWNKRFK